MTERNLERDYPIVRKGWRWTFNGKRFWFRKSAEKYRTMCLIYQFAPSSYTYHVKKGTPGY